MAAPIDIFAPAKLTLSLRMAGLRADGMHLIDAEMITLSFGDTLTIRPIDTTSSRGSSLQLPGADADIPLGPDNLVMRALDLADRRADVVITKVIPPGGGLGGGSADAAAILRWANFTDHVAAGQLGADIPFCMVGGRARVTGIGEVIEPLPFAEQSVTLLTPPFGCNTAAVYRAWDDLGGPIGENGNDLEPAALCVEPRLAKWRDQLGDATGAQPRLAGSGSTWFVDGAFDLPGLTIANATPSARDVNSDE